MAEQVPHTDKPDTKHVPDEIIDEISSLRGRIGHHINKLDEFGEGLKAKEDEMAAKVQELCDKIDIHVQNVCDEAKIIGDNMKDHVKKTFLHDEENASAGTSDTMKIKKLMEDNKTALENLKKCMETCWTVLEERSSVPMAESLNKLRQEVEDCVSRKMVIPDVPVMEFVAGEIDRDILSKQVGILVRGRMFEVWFDVNDISGTGKEYYSREIECEGMTWCVGVYRWYGDVEIGLELTKTPQGIKSCKVERCLKLVNIKDDHQSVVKHDIKTITQGGWLGPIVYKWSQLINKQAGFIDGKNQFKVQGNLKILDIFKQKIIK